MEFKDSLKSLRKYLGVNQGVIAEHLNISVKTVSHWETGYSEPSVEQLKVLADFFDVTIDELVGR